MDGRSLPLHLNLKDIEQQVRHVLHQVRRGDVVAVARWYSLDSEARTRQPRKADIQYIIAREHGFRSWQSLKDHLNKDNVHAVPAGGGLWPNEQPSPSRLARGRFSP